MVELPDGKDESDTERDGLLSYAGEWHALIVGLGAGLAAALSGNHEMLVIVATIALGIGGVARTKKTKALGEVKREPWYGLGGLCLGYLAGYATTVAGVV